MTSLFYYECSIYVNNVLQQRKSTQTYLSYLAFNLSLLERQIYYALRCQRMKSIQKRINAALTADDSA